MRKAIGHSIIIGLFAFVLCTFAYVGGKNVALAMLAGLFIIWLLLTAIKLIS